ncbi:MAG: hypothetical protein IMW91_07070 [Firmicutes bacterium]|nr:hypothetical protein [Bacillota bacterium]
MVISLRKRRWRRRIIRLFGMRHTSAIPRADFKTVSVSDWVAHIPHSAPF